MRLVCKTLSLSRAVPKTRFAKAGTEYIEIALARRTRIVPCLIPLKRVNFPPLLWLYET